METCRINTLVPWCNFFYYSYFLFFFFLIKTNAWKPKLYLGRENSQKMIFLVCCIFERLKSCFEKKSYESGEKSKNYGWKKYSRWIENRYKNLIKRMNILWDIKWYIYFHLQIFVKKIHFNEQKQLLKLI